MPDIWENGLTVHNELNENCSTNDSFLSLTCKDKDRISGSSGSQDNRTFFEYPRKPIPAPNPSHYAVLEKPGINRYVMRGCFETSDDPDLPLWNIDREIGGNINMNTKKKTICDDYTGTFCGRGGSAKNTCKNDAPGGLADFTHPMPIHGEEFLKNGFIIDRCECKLDTDQLKDKSSGNTCGAILTNQKSPTNYTCFKDKRFDTCEYDVLFTTIKDSCCQKDANNICMNEGYKIGNAEYKTTQTEDGVQYKEDDPDFESSNKIYSTGGAVDLHSGCGGFSFPLSDWTPYQPGEIWDGRKDNEVNSQQQDYTCHSWYNPSVDELPQDQKHKNNCTQYLLKWAKSCEWCKKHKSIPSNDGLQICDKGINGCSGSNQCVGDCTPTFGGLFSDSCSFYMEQECNICDSKLWDQVPGGWEALVDPDHPKHEMAMYTYIPKIMKTRENAGEKQPATMFNSNLEPKIVGDLVDNEDKVLNNKNITTFTGLGPFFDNEIIRSAEIQEYRNNKPGILFNTNETDRSGEFTWSNNYDINYKGEQTVVDHPRCSQTSGNRIGYTYDTSSNNEDGNDINRSAWQMTKLARDKHNMTNIGRRLENCTYSSPKSEDDQNPSSHTVCERNPNLTGFGECDADTDHYAKLWIDGKWDLSRYTGKTELVDEGLTKDQLKDRKIEAMRCCIGLSPKYKTKDNDYETPIDEPSLEYERLQTCRPGYTCPSSNACKDLFKDLFANKWDISEGGFNPYYFGQSYPEDFSLKGNDKMTDVEMKNSAYYAKAYCEMMSGGVQGVTNELIGCGHDHNTEVDCRKFMYNYCSTPVKVDLQDPNGVSDDIKTKSIKYPLRVFTEGCYDWCRQDKLADSLPSQKGVCDMALGKTCQQLQVDGWIDVNNWGNSKILKFADDEGNWVENPSGEPPGSGELPVGIHKGLTLDRIRNVCGCFLLGSECSGDNCSVSYCGAGTEGQKGPGPVSMERIEWDDTSVDYTKNEVNKTIYDMKNVYDYNGPRESSAWEEHIDQTEFSCYNDENVQEQQCFSGCNYVNYNDTCWLASPDERLQDTTINSPTAEPEEQKIEGFSNIEKFKDINVWECENVDAGDSCKTYNGKYGCFGSCSIDDYNVDGDVKGNCGTDEWFDHRMNINPGEREFKIRKSFYDDLDSKPPNVHANKSRNWSKWQNFYAEWKNIPNTIPLKDSNAKIDVPGWGSYKTDGDGRPIDFSSKNDPICFFPSCANDRDSVKPYKYIKSLPECGSTCSVSMQTSINNQGAVVGGIVSSLNAKNSCNLQNADWDTRALDSKNNGPYISMMGSNDCSALLDVINSNNIDCGNCTIDSQGAECNDCKKLYECTYGSQICVEAETGDNCQLCTQPKPNICCVSPNENPYESGPTKIAWDLANNLLLQGVGNYVSFICDKTCPVGSIPLETLEAKCIIPCDQRFDESSCGTCEYCTWVPENSEHAVSAHCAAVCPLPPPRNDVSQGGWGVEIENVGTFAPVPLETNPPTVAPTPTPITNEPSTGPIGETTSPTDTPVSGANIGLILAVTGGSVGFIILLVLFVLWLNSYGIR